MKLFDTLKKRAEAYLSQYKQRDPATYAAAQQAIGGILILDGLIGIDNPFGGKKRPGVFGALLGIAMGIVFMFVPTLFGNISGLDKMTATTSATVTSVGAPHTSSDSTTCTISAKYIVDGIERTGVSSSSSSSNCTKAAGDVMSIKYDPNHPSSWTNDADTFNLVFSIFFWVGVLIIISSFITCLIRIISIVFGWKLLKSGRNLAQTLPQGTNIGTVIEEIKQHFKTVVFNAPTDNTSAQIVNQMLATDQTTGAPATTPPSSSVNLQAEPHPSIPPTNPSNPV